MTADNFNKNVFINCPFDDEYKPIFHAIVFTVLACGYIPSSALQECDAAEIRLKKIQRFIRGSRFGIHDISRTELDTTSNLPRFNMPFELGLDIGAREYGDRKLKTKNILIFDSMPYRYQQFLSDISGQDISAHQNDVSKVIKRIRDWLNANKTNTEKPLPGPAFLKRKYDAFQNALPNMCDQTDLDHNDLVFNDLHFLAADWAKNNV